VPQRARGVASHNENLLVTHAQRAVGVSLDITEREQAEKQR
jgi:hypothetical protein